MNIQEIRILLIDDNEIDNEINEKLLRKKAGFQHIVVKDSGEAALEYLKNTTAEDLPDIVLLDVHMPEMDGFEFLDAFQTLSERVLKKTKIYMLTSSQDHSDLEKAQNHSYVHNIITKPLQVNQLFE